MQELLQLQGIVMYQYMHFHPLSLPVCTYFMRSQASMLSPLPALLNKNWIKPRENVLFCFVSKMKTKQQKQEQQQHPRRRRIVSNTQN